MAVLEQHAHVNIWWFPKEFCQSRFGEYRGSGTNSCTLISLILADKISKEHVHEQGMDILPPRAVEMFGDAINEGNSVYWRLFDRSNMSQDNNRSRGTPNLNIPEAIFALAGQPHMDFQLQEWFYTHLTANPTKTSYTQSVSLRIAQVMKLGMQLFQQTQSNESTRNLFAALIADSRTTLFVMEFPSNLISFFDSHQHGRQAGAVAAVCSVDYFEELTSWLIDMLFDVYHSRPAVFEISFLTTIAEASNQVSPTSIN